MVIFILIGHLKFEFEKWKLWDQPQRYFMRVSMDKNEENEEIEASFMEIKIFISRSSIEGGK